jgi:hypothetical protein
MLCLSILFLSQISFVISCPVALIKRSIAYRESAICIKGAGNLILLYF